MSKNCYYASCPRMLSIKKNNLITNICGLFVFYDGRSRVKGSIRVWFEGFKKIGLPYISLGLNFGTKI